MVVPGADGGEFGTRDARQRRETGGGKGRDRLGLLHDLLDLVVNGCNRRGSRLLQPVLQLANPLLQVLRLGLPVGLRHALALPQSISAEFFSTAGSIPSPGFSIFAASVNS
jgi:hypothetical protein